MRKARVRVESKRLPLNASKQDRDYNLVKLMRIFKRACSDYGILHTLKEHECFVRKCDIRRRKRVAKRLAATQEVTVDDKKRENQTQERNWGM